jgi:hypothetical protein
MERVDFPSDMTVRDHSHALRDAAKAFGSATSPTGPRR